MTSRFEIIFKVFNDMNLEDIKIACLNVITLGVSFTAVENSLKIILLLVSIAYTLQKIYETNKKKNK